MLWVLLVMLVVIILPSSWLQKLNTCIHVKRKNSVNAIYEIEKAIFDLKFGKIEGTPKGDFKFYGELIQKLTNLFKQNGEIHTESLDQLQSSLNTDFKFNQKKKEIFRSSWIQFLLTSAFIWIFVFGVRWVLQEELPTWTYLVIVVFQVTGGFFFELFKSLIEKRLFKGTDSLVKAMVYFRNLYSANLDMNHIIRESSIMSLSDLKLPKEFDELYLRVKVLICDWRTTGDSIETELGLYEIRLSYLREELSEKLNKKMKALQFLTLCLFFLPSYFVLILSLFNSFLIE